MESTTTVPMQEVSLLHRIFPAALDNQYRGHAAALWLLVPIALQKTAMSLTHVFTADGGAQSISTIPLDTWPAGAAQTVVGLFARMGLEQLLLASLLLLCLFRYRAMIPLMYLLIIVHLFASRGVAAMKPLVYAGASRASLPILVIALLSAIGLGLSLIGRGYRANTPPLTTRPDR